MRMKKTDYANLYAYSFMKELRALFRDRANMKNYEAKFNLKMLDFPEKERDAACDSCGDWLFEHFLFAVPEEFLEDRVEFDFAAMKDGPEKVVSVTNGITRYDFLVAYRGGLVVRHRILSEDACEDETAVEILSEMGRCA